MPEARDAYCIVCGEDEWYPVNKGSYRCAPCLRARSREQHAKHRALVLAAYGGCCCCCGEEEEAFLVIDHIEGGGTKHIMSLGGKLYRWLIKQHFPEGFQLLCANCNMAKERPDGCPHSRLEAEALSAHKEKEF